MLRCGKFRGHTHEHVKKQDRGYCAWVLRAQREKQLLTRDLRKFADHLQKQHGGVLTVGSHKGKFFDEVLAKHPDYGDWAGTLFFCPLRTSSACLRRGGPELKNLLQQTCGNPATA